MLNPAHPLYSIHKRMNHYEVAPRDPVSIATIIAPTLMAAGGTGAFLLTTAVYIAQTALVSWVVSALTPKPKASGSGNQVNQKESVGPGEVVYGEVRKGGVVTYMHSNGTDNQILHMVITLACHEVEAIGDIYINDKLVTVNGSGYVTSDPWNSKIRITKHLGSTGQLADSDLVADTPVTSNFRGRGIAYLYVRMEYDEDVFVQGVPLVTAVVKGKKVYDPRTATTAYSPNAALCIRDYLTNTVYGMSTPSGEIDDDSFSDQADICDENVAKALGGGESRYECNGILKCDQSYGTNLENLLTSCGGTLFWSQGTWCLKVAKWSTPVATFTLDNLRSEITVNTRNPQRDNFNIVRGTFISKKDDYIPSDFPEIRSSVYINEDGGIERPLDLDLPMTVSEQTAQRIAKLTLHRAREQMVVSADFDLSAVEVRVGDNVNLDIDRYGWSNKPFEVMDWALRSSGGALVVSMTLKETSSEAFQWAAEEREIINNNTDLPNPHGGLDVTGLSAVNTGELDDDGSWDQGVELTWNAALNIFVDRYQVQWKKTSATRWRKTLSDDTEVFLKTAQNKSYDFRVRAVTVSGKKGAWATLTFTTGRKPANNDAPTGFQATAISGKKIQLTWDNPDAKDYHHTRIFMNTVNDFNSATRIDTISGDGYMVQLGSRGLTRYFWIRNVDKAGNISAVVGPQSATTRGAQSDDIDDAAVSKRVNQRSGGVSGTNIVSGASTQIGYGLVNRAAGSQCVVTFSVELGEASASNTPRVEFRIVRNFNGSNTIPVTWKQDWDGNLRHVMTYTWTDTVECVGDVGYFLYADRRSNNTGTPEFYECNCSLVEIFR